MASPARHSRDASLQTLARLHGVQTSYIDMAHCRQWASNESLLAILQVLGVPIEDTRDAPAALRETRSAISRRVLEPVSAVWPEQPAPLPLRLPASVNPGLLHCEWTLESGKTIRTKSRPEHLPCQRVTQPLGLPHITRRIPVPERLPVGYHQLRIDTRLGRFESHILCAPRRTFQNRARPSWGLFAPLYALHSNRSWGAGDLVDLEDLISWTHRLGGSFVGTLPLLPAFLDEPCEPSPYSPVSRLFWNEFYLCLERVPELAVCPTAQKRLRSRTFQDALRNLRQAQLVDYPAQMTLQRQILEPLSRAFFSQPPARRRDFDTFLRQHPDLADYARFRAVHEEQRQPWKEWPARLRGGELRDSDAQRPRIQYHLYVQWLAHQQMAQLSQHARQCAVELYLDLPLGTHRDGYDTWRYPGLFALEASGGAPPDPVFTQGQDWGFPPLHPQRSREQGHAYLRAYLRHHLQHARMLRIDHVMGLHRLYWVPHGLPATHGAYVTYPADEFYAVLSIESHRHQASIIGENLGTVPPQVNRSLARHQVNGMFVVQYELRPPPHPPLRPLPAPAIASLNTHDMPPFAAFWQQLDLADRLDLGLLRPSDLAPERRRRQRLLQSLIRWLRRRRWLGPTEEDPEAVLSALLRHLGSSPARWVQVNLEDLWLETASQNTPGTSTERTNWRRKLRHSIPELTRDARWFVILGALNCLRQPRRSSQCFAEAVLGIHTIDSPRPRRHNAGVDAPNDGARKGCKHA